MRVFAVLAAVTAAALLPHAPLGMNVPVVASLVGAAVVVSGRRSLDTALFGSMALALACVPALLDAGWIAAVDVTAACLLATVAVGGPRLVALVTPFQALRGAPALVPPVPAGLPAVFRGVVLGTIVVLPFGGLFWSADAAFAELIANAPLPSLSSLPARVVVFAVVLFGALGLALAAKQIFADFALRVPTVSISEWAIPLLLLDVLFVAFVAVQVAVLFGGHDHVLDTAGLTYAEYARQGFWQLIAAAALTLGVVCLAVRVAESARRVHRTLLRTLLGALCVLTLVIVASALHRLHLYEEAFGLTRLRLGAETISWGLGGLLCLVLAAGSVPILRRQVVRTAILGIAVGLLVVSLSNPDGRIAERNIDRWRDTGNLDVSYLQGLSADAVPAMAKLPEPLRSKALAPIRARLAEEEPWTSANYSRHRARNVLRR
jgi:hypothetical protein